MLLLHHPIWVEEEYKERKRTFNRACDREEKQNKTQTTSTTIKTQTNKKIFSRCHHFSICVVLCFW